MPPATTLELFNRTQKPPLEGIPGYLSRRLTPEDPHRSRLSRSTDRLGNTVLTSAHSEVIPYRNQETRRLGFKLVPAAMVYSNEGRDLIRSNRDFEGVGLLRAIQLGRGNLVEVGEPSSEARVFRTTLQTPSGLQDFVFRYSFPTLYYTGEANAILSNGLPIDLMRAHQKAERDDPVPGFHYMTPVIATLDAAVTPYVADIVSLQKILSSDRVVSDFMKQFFLAVIQDLGIFDRWVAGIVANDDFPLVADRDSIIPDVGLRDIHVHMPTLRQLMGKVDETPDFTTTSEFVFAARDCCHISEVITSQFNY